MKFCLQFEINELYVCTKFRGNRSRDFGFRTRKPPRKFGVKSGRSQLRLKYGKKYFIGRGGVEDTRLEAKAKDTKKNPRPRPRTAFPRTNTLEAKDRNARGQGQGLRTQAQVLSKNKKRSSQKFFRRSPKKKRSSQKFFKRSPQKNVFLKIFQALHEILTVQKIVLSSSRGQANFRGLQASRPRPRT